MVLICPQWSVMHVQITKHLSCLTAIPEVGTRLQDFWILFRQIGILNYKTGCSKAEEIILKGCWNYIKHLCLRPLFPSTHFSVYSVQGHIRLLQGHKVCTRTSFLMPSRIFITANGIIRHWWIYPCFRIRSFVAKFGNSLWSSKHHARKFPLNFKLTQG